MLRRIFFFNDTATTEIYTLSLHDALPILPRDQGDWTEFFISSAIATGTWVEMKKDRKSTRLNSSHSQISYAVFCLKKKKKISTIHSYKQSSTHARLYHRCYHM